MLRANVSQVRVNMEEIYFKTIYSEHGKEFVIDIERKFWGIPVGTIDNSHNPGSSARYFIGWE